MLFRLQHLQGYCFPVDTESKTTFFVHVLRQVVDNLDSSYCVATCVIVEKQDFELHKRVGPEIKGACLHIRHVNTKGNVEHDGEKTNVKVSYATGLPGLNTPTDFLELHAIYDCPLRVWEVADSTITPESEAAASKLLYPRLADPLLDRRP
jgi:hypothetical protein